MALQSLTHKSNNNDQRTDWEANHRIIGCKTPLRSSSPTICRALLTDTCWVRKELSLPTKTLHFFVFVSHFLLSKPTQLSYLKSLTSFCRQTCCSLLGHLLLATAFGLLCALSSCFNFSYVHFLHPSPQLCSSHEHQNLPYCAAVPLHAACSLGCWQGVYPGYKLLTMSSAWWGTITFLSVQNQILISVFSSSKKSFCHKSTKKLKGWSP